MLKKILAISNHACMLGGGEYSFFDLMTRMPKAFKPICTLPGDGELADRLRDKDMQVKVITLPAIRPWLLPGILMCIRNFADICWKIKPDLIYANGSRAAIYGGVVGRALKIPVIWHCRVMNTDKYLDYLLGMLCTRIIVNSHATGRRFGGKFKNKVKVIYNGVDSKWILNGNPVNPDLILDDWKVILVAARVSKSKRHDVVLQAFKTIACSDPRVHLVCMGARDRFEPQWWNYLQEKTKRTPFPNRVHWIGQVEDVRPWYRAASIVVSASENEAFGRTLVEAMASGVPVVATRAGGVPEIVRDRTDGFLVTPADAAELSAAVIKLLADDNLRLAMGNHARQRSKAFRLERHVREMSAAFNELCN